MPFRNSVAPRRTYVVHMPCTEAVEIRFARPLIYLWTLPTTSLGFVFLLPAIARIGRARVVDGAIEIDGPIVTFFLKHGTLRRGGASAMTLGHIVIGRDQTTLDLTRKHERVHVRQAERWGPLFVPAYITASLIAWMRGKQAYRDNAFEVEAYGSTSNG